MVYPTYSIQVIDPQRPIPVFLQWKVITEGDLSDSILLQLEVTYLDLKIWRRTLRITIQSLAQQLSERS